MNLFGDALAYLCDDADPSAATLVQIHQDHRDGDSLDPLRASAEPGLGPARIPHQGQGVRPS